MSRFALLLALALAACRVTPHQALAGIPDLRTPSGVSVYWAGQPPAPMVTEWIEHTHRAAISVCPTEHRAELARLWPQIEIQWEPTGFDCGGRRVEGCAWTATALQVALTSALVDELGHSIWWTCFGRSGENAGAVYDADFKAWVDETAATAPGSPCL